MKKNIFLAALLAVSMGAAAQNFYTFTKSEATYEDLSDTVPMNTGEAWINQPYGPFESPFSLFIFGEALSSFGFSARDSGSGNMEISVYFHAFHAFVMGRGFSDPATSPISYKIEGEEGSRILKLEVKNAGLLAEFDYSSSTSLSTYLNYQVWLYEEDSSIEYHY